jgi:hypothetical protein
MDTITDAQRSLAGIYAELSRNSPAIVFSKNEFKSEAFIFTPHLPRAPDGKEALLQGPGLVL